MAVDEKMKILYLMRILMTETDELHTMNALQLSEKIKAMYGLSYERKTIYTDIKRLQDFGIRIGQVKGRTCGYYVEKRDFDVPELKLLVDAVQSSKFITRGKSEELIRKLGFLTSRESAKQLQRQVYIFNRIKAENDSIYENVDTIHAAMRDDLQISFKYCVWTVRKELVRKKNGLDYIVSPWALTWDDENYYLVGYDADTGKIKHYRVDKMQEISITEDERLGKEQFIDFDLAAFAKKTFGMYGGEDRKLTLEGENHMVGVVIDRFGTDIMISRHDENHFHAVVTVSVSPQFFGWLTGIGKGLCIVGPEDVRNEYREYLEEILDAGYRRS